VSKSWFPDILGPSKVGANGATAIGIRRRRLNIASSGVSAVDDPAKQRTDVTIPDPTWSVISAPTSTVGEWLPADTAFSTVDLVRVTSSVSGTLMTGLDSTSNPTKLVKYVANYGTNTITLQAPASPVVGKQYFGSTYALAANSTVRVTWDAVSLVYRLKGAPVVTDGILLDGDLIVLDSDQPLNPQ